MVRTGSQQKLLKRTDSPQTTWYKHDCSVSIQARLWLAPHGLGTQQAIGRHKTGPAPERDIVRRAGKIEKFGKTVKVGTPGATVITRVQRSRWRTFDLAFEFENRAISTKRQHPANGRSDCRSALRADSGSLVSSAIFDESRRHTIPKR